MLGELGATAKGKFYKEFSASNDVQFMNIRVMRVVLCVLKENILREFLNQKRGKRKKKR